MPTKQRVKPRVLWETLVVRKQCADVKIASTRNRRNPTNINTQKLKKAQNERMPKRTNRMHTKSD